jgi:hypothetical protein
MGVYRQFILGQDLGKDRQGALAFSQWQLSVIQQQPF